MRTDKDGTIILDESEIRNGAKIREVEISPAATIRGGWKTLADIAAKMRKTPGERLVEAIRKIRKEKFKDERF